MPPSANSGDDYGNWLELLTTHWPGLKSMDIAFVKPRWVSSNMVMELSSRGLTLHEFIISLSISAVGFIVLSSLAMLGFNEFIFIKAKLETQGEAYRFQYLMTSLFTQGVNVGGGNLPPAGTEGRVRNDFNFSTMGSVGGNWALIAVFNREVGGLGNVPSPPQYRRTAVWYRAPSPLTSGVVFFDTGGGGGAMTATYDDAYSSRITEFEMAKELGGTGRLSGLRVRAVFRYQRPSSPLMWCPTADRVAGVAGCNPPLLNYQEFTKSFRIVMRNNTQGVAPNGGVIEERPLGLLYFFHMLNPARWNL